MGVVDSPLRDTMVFLVGARRSGTNWLQRVLATHPDVYAIPSETHLFYDGLRPLSDRIQHGAVEGRRTGAVFMDRGDFVESARGFCDRLYGGLRERSDPGASRIVERTPWHAYSVDLIADVYPDSWVLHIIRDGRDVARSLLAQPWGPEAMPEAAREWREAVESARAARKPERYREVRYEELLADPAATVPELVGWLGLEADGGTVERMLTEAGIRYNTDPSKPAARAGKWTELPASQLAEFAEVAGELNAELGYGDAPPGAAGGGDGAGTRARRRLGAARSRLRGKDPDADFRREALNRLEYSEYVFELLLEGFHVDPDRLRELFTGSADVRVVDGDGDWSGRGPEAVERLIETLATDPVRRGRQLRGDVHRGLPTFTGVLAYELPDGTRADRVITAQVRGKEITGVSIYTMGA